MRRTICGYASVFGQPDMAGDEILSGAFRASLSSAKAPRVRMLYQHDQTRPIGRWREIRETAKGLWVEGQLAPDVSLADEVAALIEHGALDGLSIGFRVQKALPGGGRIRRRLQAIDLVEISIVTFPMQPLARVQTFEPSGLNQRCAPVMSASFR